MKKEDIKACLIEIQGCIEDAQWDLSDTKREIDQIWEKISDKCDKQINDIDNFKRELRKDGLYTDEMEEFLENYMKYYNK